MKRRLCLSMLLSLSLVVFFGCADVREKTTAAEISEHFKNYAKLKQNDPVAARGELYACGILAPQGTPEV